jgi:hypothetical protein
MIWTAIAGYYGVGAALFALWFAVWGRRGGNIFAAAIVCFGWGVMAVAFVGSCVASLITTGRLPVLTAPS